MKRDRLFFIEDDFEELGSNRDVLEQINILQKIRQFRLDKCDREVTHAVEKRNHESLKVKQASQQLAQVKENAKQSHQALNQQHLNTILNLEMIKTWQSQERELENQVLKTGDNYRDSKFALKNAEVEEANIKNKRKQALIKLERIKLLTEFLEE